MGFAMAESKSDVLILMLMGIVILLMVAIIGLFLRMNQLQREVLAALAPLQIEAIGQELGLEVGGSRIAHGHLGMTLPRGTPAMG